MKSKLEFTSKSKLSRALTLYYGGSEVCAHSHSFGPAIRQHYLLHYILNGKGKYYVNNKCYELKKGEGFLICPGKSTYYKADKEDPWEYCWISFDGYDTGTILKSCGLSKENLVFKDNGNGSFKDNILTLIHNYEINSNNEYALLGQLYLCFSSIYDLSDSKERNTCESYADKALDYIYNHFSYDIKISDIAKYVGIDRTYLYKIFIEEYNISPQQYLISFRLNTAVNLLETTKMNITEISYSCGFRDTPTFYKHFKKQFNVTPIQYRKSIIDYIKLS
ncbi:AraC family transcriptional regulator [Clostridium beijerinckii]|uniref:AraC family transcriptional regulator n=1 Tax=Clostridium beijerinckii TaxID=1520 RepID=A0A0B5QM33_CLOBE|nr:AraC family transcriptional regulator [Clostridium beijerinckii]AJH01931.1 AraC family transcriptional regulator [Clostridium beijerinckii]